jgi:hypothetical protein
MRGDSAGSVAGASAISLLGHRVEGRARGDADVGTAAAGTALSRWDALGARCSLLALPVAGAAAAAHECACAAEAVAFDSHVADADAAAAGRAAADASAGSEDVHLDRADALVAGPATDPRSGTPTALAAAGAAVAPVVAALAVGLQAAASLGGGAVRPGQTERGAGRHEGTERGAAAAAHRQGPGQPIEVVTSMASSSATCERTGWRPTAAQQVAIVWLCQNPDAAFQSLVSPDPR